MKIGNKTKFTCQNCGYSTGKWLGQCPDCNSWNTMVEEFNISSDRSGPGKSQSIVKELFHDERGQAPQSIDQVDA